MRARALTCAAAVLFMGFTRPDAKPAAPPAGAVDQLFAEWTGADTPGCAVGVGRNGAAVLERAYGMADLEHGVTNTPATVFEAGSVSKQFTATAVVLLAQRGALSLDDPVHRHVPELPDYGAPVTLRQMLHHTSGLRDWGVVASAAGWPRGSRAHTHDHVLDILSRQKALNYVPGDEYLYTNSGYNLSAMVVARASGQSFAEFSRKNVFEPLGMGRTEWRDDFTRLVKGRATAYSKGKDGWHLRMPFEDVHGNGGLLTTVGDLLRWNENFTAPKVGGPELVAQLQTPGRLNDGREIRYGLGLAMGDLLGVREVAHSGSTAGYRAFLARYPDHGLSVAVLCNAQQADAPRLGREVAALFLEEALEPLPQAVAVEASALESRVGLYRSTRGGDPLRLAVRDGRLVMGGWRELVPLSPNEFRFGFGSARVVFEDAAGRAAFRYLFPEGEVYRYEAVAAASPTPAELVEYAGEYASDEAEVTYRVAVEGGGLVLKTRPATTLPLEPSYRDAFTGPGGFVLFRRDEAGRVNGLSLGMGRVRDLRFRRVPPR